MTLVNLSVIDGQPGELQLLFGWLQRVDELRRKIETRFRQPNPHEMGPVREVLSVAIGSGGAGAVLAAR